MKKIVLREPGQFEWAENQTAFEPGSDEALVRVHRVGICGTDLHAFQGNQPFFTYPRVLGHELGVEVLSVGKNVTHIQPKDYCAVEPYLYCGSCGACLRGKTNCCMKMQVLGVHVDGGMRQTLLVPARNLHKSETLSLDQLTLVEPLCIGAHAVSRAEILQDEWALVIGAGPIGLSVIQFAGAAGARVIVLDISEERLSFAQTNLNVSATINADSNVIESLKELTNGDMPTVVFDATGNPRSMQTAFNYPGHGGRLVFVGLFQGDVTFHDPDAHRRELTLLCSRNAVGDDFRNVIRLMETGVIDITPWITHRVVFGSDVIEQFPQWLDPRSKFIKAVIEV